MIKKLLYAIKKYTCDIEDKLSNKPNITYLIFTN